MNGPNDVDGEPFPKRHEGHGGYTIDSDGSHSGISGQITDQGLSMYSPNIVLLMIGTNDLNGNVDVNNAPNRLGNLMDDILTQAPNALLVVASVIPMENGNGNKVAPYNATVTWKWSPNEPPKANTSSPSTTGPLSLPTPITAPPGCRAISSIQTTLVMQCSAAHSTTRSLCTCRKPLDKLPDIGYTPRRKIRIAQASRRVISLLQFLSDCHLQPRGTAECRSRERGAFISRRSHLYRAPFAATAISRTMLYNPSPMLPGAPLRCGFPASHNA